MTQQDPAARAELRSAIEDAFDRRGSLTSDEIDESVRPRVEQAISLLESGEARVAEPSPGGWPVNDWW